MPEMVDREVHEACAAVVVSSIDLPASFLAYQGLAALQLRGEEASGMSTNSDTLSTHRSLGRVDNVYNKKILRRKLKGSTAVGHNRYSTSGNRKRHLQPVDDHNLAYAFAENGNNPEPEPLAEEIHSRGLNPNGMNDSEMRGSLIASEIRAGYEGLEAVKRLYSRLGGASFTVFMQGPTAFALKDSHGVKPGVLGRLPDGGYMAASETSALDTVGAEVIREIGAGEMVMMEGKYHEFVQLGEKRDSMLDIFEILYFSSPDSMQFGEYIAEYRTRLGEQLAVEHPIESDIVIPVPTSGIFAGEGYADTLGIPRPTSLMKNRYIQRTFILPEQLRNKALLNKIRPIPSRVRGKEVTVVDDTKVRGSTMKVLVEKLKVAGANKVNVLIASPPVVYPDFYGIDTKSQDELIAANLSMEEMRDNIDADYLGYLSMAGMLKALNIPAEKLNLSCFTGEYPIKIGKRDLEIRQPKTKPL